MKYVRYEKGLHGLPYVFAWLMVVAFLTLFAVSVWAAYTTNTVIAAGSVCTTNTILLPNGALLICTTCCQGQNCSTQCIQ